MYILDCAMNNHHISLSFLQSLLYFIAQGKVCMQLTTCMKYNKDCAMNRPPHLFVFSWHNLKCKWR